MTGTESTPYQANSDRLSDGGDTALPATCGNRGATTPHVWFVCKRPGASDRGGNKNAKNVTEVSKSPTRRAAPKDKNP
jgi:hypothetical protein